ncbi:probable disease resistance protein At1g58602 [Syzygium oleosum]|uniref:probable disease resistance protein At1g58602 n=1 Tax=Syzygium oleosum TaxID=219896 RepID=UPI0024B88C2D|nr:probable disease resistance protein At1g58602 [Syzygium oleosum]XP_056173754.1 probable disease resistance protein At1g58602 [Syzygium oleosum]XP_056173755.1 probable disease resistance protein At1g58602 [Syzygium oleosum]XP_056173756.1 probable disease resistance protein At1g58602 [Syzygium oleosum]XP_056173757.1 probable disease resistance protein At1g58602 [Syzygium oleosum]XP_056173758.1 probable disease resistance protein At1g58602 [Syzygium oleosum]XP_056173759.1 probable disease res
MAEYVVLSVGQTIGKLLIDEAKLLWGVEGTVKDLQKEMELIQGFMRDADARQEREQAVGVWIAQLRDIAYDAEDVIERYILRVARKKGQNIIKAYACFIAKCMCLHVHVVGRDIKGLKSSISDLRAKMQVYGIQPVNDSERKQTRALMPERSYAYFEEDIVGREDSIKVLVKALKDGKHNRVVSIWGMGGLGKTTLAKKVFAHNEVKSNFHGFASACISKNFHVREILVGIFEKLIPDKKEGVMHMREEELFETLYKIQQEKRCIVFLDDIWTKEDWKAIRAAFPIKNTRSKLLITTRNREVAEYIDSHGFLHKPMCLSNQESWKLLMKRVFPETKRLDIGPSSVGQGVGQATVVSQAVEGITRRSETEGQGQEITENMKTFGDELLRKCGGLPLAVKVLGGLLAANEWEKIYRNINSYLSNDDDLSKVLALSFDDLPWHLKPCFLYLASFPEDEEIPVKKVLHMWIAEGFVLPTAYGGGGEITVEVIAERYLMELVKRGMVQGQFKSSGKIKTCHLHDVMRELCIPKAKQFLSIINIKQDHETEDRSSSIGMEGESTCKTRRLSLNMHGSAKGNSFSRVEQIGRTMLHLRTLMFFYSGGSVDGMWEQFRPICINNKFLRVLKLEHLINMSGNLPEAVGDLVHLRYLSLAGSKFEGLPQSMAKLVRMEFLDLCMGQRVTVPNVLWKMRRLRHLYLPYRFAIEEKLYGNRKKLQLDTLKSLQTLRNFHLKNCDMNDLGKLTNLRKLTLATIDHADDQLEKIPELAKFDLKHLESLSFDFSCFNFNISLTEGELSKMSNYPHSCKLSILGKIEKLPEHNNLPQQLRKLFLFYSELEEDPMPILEKLHHLVVLVLFYAFKGKEMVCFAGGFPQLKRLVLDNLRNLEEWRVAKGAMPHLSRLGISHCPRLKAVPRRVHTYDSSEEVYHEYRKHCF